MDHSLTNQEYDEDLFLVKKIAEESPLFKSYIQAALNNIDSDFPSEEIWLGTLAIGKEKVPTQIKLSISQKTEDFIDEN